LTPYVLPRSRLENRKKLRNNIAVQSHILQCARKSVVCLTLYRVAQKSENTSVIVELTIWGFNLLYC